MDIARFYLCILVLIFSGNIKAFEGSGEMGEAGNDGELPAGHIGEDARSEELKEPEDMNWLKSTKKGSDNDDLLKKTDEEADDDDDDDDWFKTYTDKKSKKKAEDNTGWNTGIGDSDFDWDGNSDGDSDGESDSTTTAKYGLNKGWDSNSDSFEYPEIPVVDTDTSFTYSNSDSDSSLSGGHVAGITGVIALLSIGAICLRICLCAKRLSSSGTTSGRTISPGTGYRVLSVTSLADVPTGPDSDRVGLIAERQTRISRA